MAECLVVGGNGFLGSYVVDELVALGHNVTAFDRFTEPANHYTSLGVRRVVGDFMDPADLAAALTGQEYLFHFLSTTTPATAESDPELDVRTNVAQTVVLLELAVAAGVSCVYFASTGGAMYGDVELETIDENVVPAPLSPYAIGKLAIEGYLRYFERKHGLRWLSYRISNPYGPRQHPHKKQGVIPIFLQRVAAGEPLELFGDGSMVRDYVFAADTAKMIARTVGQPTEYSVYNIGSGTGSSLNDLVDLARRVTGKQIEVLHTERPTTFIDRVVLDVARYNAEFGPIELVGLEDGMARTWRDTVEHAP